MMPQVPFFRAEAPGDDAIVARLRAGDGPEAATAGWPLALVDSLRRQQWQAQERHLDAYHPDLERRMILIGGEPVGRLCLDRSTAPWHLVDIALLPERRGHGIGTAVLRAILADAARDDAWLVLEVGGDNPRAEALYRRLGFTDVPGHTTTHRRLESRPPLADP